MSSHRPFLEISCQQVMAEDASVFSVQWTDLPVTMAGAFSAEKLLTSYLGYIKKCTLGLIRPVTLDNRIEFRLIGTGRSLISFLPPVYTDGFAILRISGGLLVQPRRCDHGKFSFGVEHHPGSVRVSLQLSNFYPLILGSKSPPPVRVWLYRVTQAAIHRLVTIRFLTQIHQDLGGPSAEVRVINVTIRGGKPV